MPDVSIWSMAATSAPTSCASSARTVGRVQGPNLGPTTRMTLRVQDPRHVDTVRRLRCPSCSGRVWIQNSESIHVDRRPLTTEDLEPRAGRRPKIGRAS